jgi:putative ABC transport system permease protein
VAEAREKPERIGLFGFLSIGFITTTALSTLALAIYAFFSFRQRYIQLGILRAIGLSSGQLASSLGGEQIFVTGIAIAMGAYLGLLTSQMFIPFYQIGYNQAELVPPFIVAIAWDDVLKIVAMLAVMLLLTTAGLIWLLMRLKTFQAIKLGETLL